MADKNGGPAFPTTVPPTAFSGFGMHPGMTLRDWFAGQALIGLLAGAAAASKWASYSEQAYDIADAMLEEREKKRD